MQPLRDCRRRQLLSRADLSAAAGVSEKALGDIERGRATPRLSTIRKITDALNVAPGDVTEFAAVLGDDGPNGADDATVPADVIAGGV